MTVANHLQSSNGALRTLESTWAEAREVCKMNLREFGRDLRFVLEGFFYDRCRHSNLAWPQSGEQVCLNCSKRWKYDWDRMRRGSAVVADLTLSAGATSDAIAVGERCIRDRLLGRRTRHVTSFKSRAGRQLVRWGASLAAHAGSGSRSRSR